jgi:hypothetical protein
MAKEVLELEVKSNIKSVAKDQKAWNKELETTKENIADVNEEGKEVVAEMQVLGLSINGLKAAWNSAASGAKFLFRSVKMGIISTGVGAFVVALGTITTWFTTTKRGAEVLETAMAGVGAAFKVVIDRVADFGGGLFKLLSGDIKEGLKDMGNSFKNIGEEIKTDTLLTMALTKQNQKLADSQRALNVETAQRRADIEELKLIAEDTTKTEAVRLKAAQDAFKIENDLLDRNIANATEAVRLEKLRQETISVQKEDLDKLAQLEIDLANIRGESTTKQIELNNKINSIKQEGQAKELEALEKLKAADAERMGTLTKMPSLVAETNEEIIQADNTALETYKTQNEDRKKSDEAVEAAKKQIAQKGLQLITAIAGEGSAIGKAAAIASVTMSGVESVQNAFNTAQKSPVTVAFPAYPFVQAGLAGAFSAVQLQKIISGGKPTAGGNGGGGRAASATPAPQMMSGQFELGGGIAPEPVKAFVITDEMTSSQAQLANIRRRATI